MQVIKALYVFICCLIPPVVLVLWCILTDNYDLLVNVLQQYTVLVRILFISIFGISTGFVVITEYENKYVPLGILCFAAAGLILAMIIPAAS
jgi:hypothetical protein